MKIALGLSGGIAAYKAAELVRQLQDRGVRVQVIMTAAAQEFVRPLTFAALSGEKV
ncbi:MAG: flavoprotein, partial [Terriglobales bacterium]